ncbi:MAG: peptidyl-prolyl cis-trans isomerase [Syntrophomonadaceae bacterium]|nr:peptidyl-prolyl cis-trans isomerase [Syntrophomonadaceae bacterium]MDD3888966.1 peptidyl-prolyl cis-trans isomerase [Syntrophomonadaceae bacterium]MDD4549179.1 peptidyl-prolyl cis-trans isomerase [Syntrophomonadaceae bacterium]
MKNKFMLFLVLIAMGLFVVGCNGQAEEIAGTVNGEQITQENLNQHYNLIKINYEMQTGSKLDEEKDKDIADKIMDQAWEDMVLQKIIWQEAKRQGIEIDNKEVDTDLKQFKDMSNQEDANGYKDFLEKSGLTEANLVQELKTEKLYWKLQDKVASSVKVSEAEVKKYYDDNLDAFKQPEGMEISHILVTTEKEAKDILVKLKEGKDFAELARQYSTCPSKEHGGELGIVNQDANYVPEFKEAALKLKPGEITPEPVKSEFGYHIIKAGAQKQAQVTPFAEVKSPITLQLEQQKKSEVFNKHLEELHKKAEIKDNRTK